MDGSTGMKMELAPVGVDWSVKVILAAVALAGKAIWLATPRRTAIFESGMEPSFKETLKNPSMRGVTRRRPSGVAA
jgi:hypothetical protein